jgi:hypothetical protein
MACLRPLHLNLGKARHISLVIQIPQNDVPQGSAVRGRSGLLLHQLQWLHRLVGKDLPYFVRTVGSASLPPWRLVFIDHMRLDGFLRCRTYILLGEQLNIRNAAAAALTLAAAVTLGACGSPAQPEASSTASPAQEATSPGSAGAARDAYELWCEDASSRSTSYYVSLADAWASIPGNRPVRCHAEVRKGDADPQFAAADKAAIDEIRTKQGSQDEKILFGLLVSTCAGWVGEADAQILTSEGNKKLGAVLDVCPDAPHAYEMLKTYKKPPVDSPKTATATPAPPARLTPSPSPSPTLRGQ